MSHTFSHHPERLRWNERFRTEEHRWNFNLSPLLESALIAGMPDGPALELACGVSGNALALAKVGRDVLAVDISDLALERLATEAKVRGLSHRITCEQANLPAWRPPDEARFALVLCVMYWDTSVFDYAFKAVEDGGIIAWQAFNPGQLRYRPSMPADICLQPGEPASRLPSDFTVLEEHDIDNGRKDVHRMIARRVLS